MIYAIDVIITPIISRENISPGRTFDLPFIIWEDGI